MGRRELREHIFRLLFRRDFFPEEEMKEQEAFYIEYLADPEQKEVDYIVQKTEKIMAMIPELDNMVNEHSVGWQTERMGKVDLTKDHPHIRHSQFGSRRWRRCTQIRHKINDRRIGLMPHCRNHRNRAFINRSGHNFFIKGP